MTDNNKPHTATDSTPENGANNSLEGVHTGEGGADSSNFQPTIDAHQVGASEA